MIKIEEQKAKIEWAKAELKKAGGNTPRHRDMQKCLKRYQAELRRAERYLHEAEEKRA